MTTNRNHYRVEFPRIPLVIHSDNQTNSGFLKDISGNGLGFISSSFFLVDAILHISFQFRLQSFELDVKIKRKNVLTYPDIFYGCEIIHLSEQEKYELRLKIARLDITK